MIKTTSWAYLPPIFYGLPDSTDSFVTVGIDPLGNDTGLLPHSTLKLDSKLSLANTEVQYISPHMAGINVEGFVDKGKRNCVNEESQIKETQTLVALFWINKAKHWAKHGSIHL